MHTARFKGVIFDMDGTLTHPAIDFPAIRAELGIGDGDIAAHILSLPSGEQPAAWGVVERHEEEALPRQEMKPGMQSLLRDLRDSGVKLGILTRNAQPSVDALCAKYNLSFDAVVTRDFPHVKPHPGPILHILEQWGMPAADVLMVGDYVHDVDCGRAAGTRTCFLHNDGFPDHGADADYTVRSADELRAIVFAG
jgi:HAD superfamily hydrolase (TIGR01509 family)